MALLYKFICLSARDPLNIPEPLSSYWKHRRILGIHDFLGTQGPLQKKTKEALIKTQDSLEELWDSRHQPGIFERKWTTEGVQWGFLHKMPPPEVGTGLDQFGTYDGTMGTMGPWKKSPKKTRVGRLYQHTWLQVSNGDHPKLFSQGRSHGRFYWSQLKPALSWRTWRLTLGGWIRSSIAMHSCGASP